MDFCPRHRIRARLFCCGAASPLRRARNSRAPYANNSCGSETEVDELVLGAKGGGSSGSGGSRSSSADDLFRDVQCMHVGLREKHIPSVPAGLPWRRRRALTLPLPDWTESPTAGPVAESQTTHAQAQAPLFARLPLEIRLRIYEAVFGHRTVHVDLTFYHPDKKSTRLHQQGRVVDFSRPKEWKWRHSVCHRGSGIRFWEDGCRDGVGTNCPDHSGVECKLHLDILRTCRKIYSESISILYSTNTFHFMDTYQIHDLRKFIRPQRFSSITSVVLSRQWREPWFSLTPFQPIPLQPVHWSLLLSLPNLRHLHVYAGLRPPVYGSDYLPGDVAGFGLRLGDRDFHHYRDYRDLRDRSRRVRARGRRRERPGGDVGDGQHQHEDGRGDSNGGSNGGSGSGGNSGSGDMSYLDHLDMEADAEVDADIDIDMDLDLDMDLDVCLFSCLLDWGGRPSAAAVAGLLEPLDRFVRHAPRSLEEVEMVVPEMVFDCMEKGEEQVVVTGQSAADRWVERKVEGAAKGVRCWIRSDYI